MNDVIALIPARGGSKGILRKNLLLLGGYPLVAFAVAAAKLSKHISRAIVVTDDEEIAAVAREFGAETPFKEPAKIAGGRVKDLEWVRYTVQWLQKNEGVVLEYLVELRPTTPLRDPKEIDKAIELFKRKPEATSLRSGYELHEPPQKLFGIGEGRYFKGLFPDDPRPEYYNLPRQTFPPAYQPDGYVDILKASHILERGDQHGDKMLAFITENTGEIDSPSEVPYIRFKLRDKRWEIYEWLVKNFPAV